MNKLHQYFGPSPCFCKHFLSPYIPRAQFLTILDSLKILLENNKPVSALQNTTRMIDEMSSFNFNILDLSLNNSDFIPFYDYFAFLYSLKLFLENDKHELALLYISFNIETSSLNFI
jgi:hypothetical protein